MSGNPVWLDDIDKRFEPSIDTLPLALSEDEIMDALMELWGL